MPKSRKAAPATPAVPTTDVKEVPKFCAANNPRSFEAMNMADLVLEWTTRTHSPLLRFEVEATVKVDSRSVRIRQLR